MHLGESPTENNRGCDKLDTARQPGRTHRTDLSRQHVVGGAKRNGQRFFTAAL